LHQFFNKETSIELLLGVASWHGTKIATLVGRVNDSRTPIVRPKTTPAT